MESIRKRLDGNLPQFLEEVKRYGRWEAMRKWDLERSYLPVAKIIWEETGDEHFGLNPTANSYIKGGVRGLLQECISTLADVYIKKERENLELKRQLEAYRMNDGQVEHEFVEEISGLMEALKAEG